MATLIDELKSDPEAGFSLQTITCKCIAFLYLVVIQRTVAVKRKYESDRRLFNDASKGEDFQSERIKKAKYGRRKQRVRILLLRLPII